MKLTKVFVVLLVGILLWACEQGPAVQEKTSLSDDKEKSSYALGKKIGGDFQNQMLDLDLVAFYTGIKHGYEGKEGFVTDAEINELLMKLQQESMQKMQAKHEEDGKRNKDEGEKFLSENASKEGVKVTESGLQYKVIESGSGKSPEETDKVKVHYTGRLLDGTVFDSSVESGQPAEFPVNGVIQGWQEVLQLMKEGDKWEVYIPGDLAYGERGMAQAGIGPNSVLVFEVSLISVL